MSNSPLVNYTKISPCNSGKRTMTIDRITPHCVVGQSSVESLGERFQNKTKEISANYGIGYDGRVGLYVDEDKRSWCSSSNANDQRAVTIECASDKTHPYKMNDAVYRKLIELCVDICKRNGKKKLLWFADKTKTLNYAPKSDEMVITVHRWFDNKACPGDWLYSRLGELAKTVTERLNPQPATEPAGVIYRVQIGAFGKKENADALAKQAQEKGFDATVVKYVKGDVDGDGKVTAADAREALRIATGLEP